MCSSQSQSLLIRRVVSVSVFLPFGVYFALTKMTKITFQLERFYHFKIRKVRYWLQPISYRSLLIGDVCDHHTFGEKSEGRILVWKSSADLYFPVQSVMHDQEKSFFGLRWMWNAKDAELFKITVRVRILMAWKKSTGLESSRQFFAFAPFARSHAVSQDAFSYFLIVIHKGNCSKLLKVLEVTFFIKT